MKRKWQIVLVLMTAGACAGRAALTYTFLGGYSQNFDALTGAEGLGDTWTDNSTIAGWYSSETTFNVNHGNSTTAALYDFGATGSSDRALGSVAGGGHTYYYGVAFQNGTGASIISLQICYHGEEWREGDNANTLTFQYFIGDPSGIKSTQGGWTEVSGLDFTSPVYGSNTSLDGNANSCTVSYTITGLNITTGSDFWLRWKDVDDAGNDAGLAVDDLSIQAIPEPAGWGMLSGTALLVFCGFQWMRQRVTRMLPAAA